LKPLHGVLALVALAGGLAAFFAASAYFRHGDHADGHSHAADALKQTSMAIEGGEPLEVPPLINAEGAAFGTQQLRGRWSVVFFGYTSCPDVCPLTLQVLSEVARDPASGVAAATTQLVFVSVDPERDTRERLNAYVGHFDRRIQGLTGSREAVERFAAALGASSQRSGSAIDHSTSLYVVDPHGRLAAILLRPSDPALIVADLNSLRPQLAAKAHVSHAH
jgi:protein SCO1/2